MPKLEMFRQQATQSFPADEMIFQQGHPRTFMFVVNEGEVDQLVEA